MHLLLLSYLLIPLKYNVHFFIAIANDREITQKDKDQVRTLTVSKQLFFVETKNRPKIALYCIV